MISSLHVLHVVGARPNFMKVAPVYRALEARAVRQTLVHTGQHYDSNMAGVFFEQLGIPVPDEDLAVGSGSHALQTSTIMARFEPVLLASRPDVVLVYGDVNSTVAAALVCAKLSVPVAHVEAGLRSFDRGMPEEINRVVTDQLADVLYTPSPDGDENLLREGIAPSKIKMVGNVMIDTVVRLLPQALKTLPSDVPRPYALLTLHRPSNVDDPKVLAPILNTLIESSRQMDILFPVHPRTRQRLKDFGMIEGGGRLRLLDPKPYMEFLALQHEAAVVITDSGGIQEETTFLGVPCLTLRDNTERPITITCGTNILIGHDMARLMSEMRRALDARVNKGRIPDLWDGKAGERIAEDLLQRFIPVSELKASFYA